MASVTFTDPTGNTPADWNDLTNWATALPASTDDAVLNTSTTGVTVFIAGGTVDNVASVTMDNAALFVGAAGPGFTGTVVGSGTLIASGTINAGGNILSGVAGSTIIAEGGFLSAGPIGGGGTFIAGTTGAGTFDNEGQLTADGGDYGLGALVVDAGAITGGGGIQIYGGSTLELNATTTQLIDITPSTQNVTGPAVLELDQPVADETTPIQIEQGQALDLLVQAAGAVTGTPTFDTDTDALSFTVGSTTYNYTVTIADGDTPTVTVDTSAPSGYAGVEISDAPPVCFARGTRIATATGEVAVEDLKIGDEVRTASGPTRPVVWIGHRRTNCIRHAEPRKALPVRIEAGAFGPSLPARDLYVSPQHAIYAEGVLIPAKMLINGRTVTQVQVTEIEYFHVELDGHDILLAEGLPAESYLDTGDRAVFENGGGAMILHPDFSRWAWDARACAELKVTGPEVTAVRNQLARRAAAKQARKKRAEATV